ncbi:MAG: rhomboid family intramembrane serine protease [Planctomycetaceae bacterium]|nr:MAG: rhomboid family intramembrane serine protease [Planctomycetaceae bacterium]
MIPLYDSIPSRTTPLVNYAMIGVCSLVFFAQLADESEGTAPLVERLGMIPARVLNPEEPIQRLERIAVVNRFGQIVEVVNRPRQLASPPFNPWWTLLTCTFLHGGWMHFLSNMWFLFIFGDNVEDRLGHVGYLLFYLFSGVAASAAHLASDPSSQIPTIGASGAIASVMGAYLLLYPRATVVSLIPIVFILQVVVLPAPVFLGVWFVLQFFQGLGAVGSLQTSGVAWWAHIGGFVFGFLIAAGLCTVGETRPPVQARRPRSQQMTAYRYRR